MKSLESVGRNSPGLADWDCRHLHSAREDSPEGISIPVREDWARVPEAKAAWEEAAKALGGFDRIVGRDIGIKMALPKYAEDMAARRMFLREAKVAGCLLHPNILPVFDVGVNRERRMYYTMRLVNGTSLRDSLDSLSKGCETSLVEFPLRKVVGVFLRVCEGVDYAHSRHVIHLDLKPDNILVSGFSEVFVIDWGLAQVEGRDETKGMVEIASETGATSISLSDKEGHRVLGTPGYMAPEQWVGDPERFRPSTDVFGLGGVLYYILYGTPPCLPKGVTRKTVEAYTRDHTPTPGDLRSGIFARGERVADDRRESLRRLEAICMRSLQRDQGARYQSAESVEQGCVPLQCPPRLSAFRARVLG